MNHNKFQAKIFNPKRHAKRRITGAQSTWLINGAIAYTLIIFAFLGWI